MINKVKITQKEFDDIYDIEKPMEITGETEDSGGKHNERSAPMPNKPDTTPFLSEEEQEIDDKFAEDYPIPNEEEEK